MAGEIDKELVTVLKAAHLGKAMQFAFLPKGQAGKLIVAKKVAPKQVNEAKKEVGTNTVYSGRCIGENGTLFFEVTKEPPGNLRGLLERQIKESAGLKIPVEIRVNANAESEGEEASADEGNALAPPPPSPTEDGARAALIARLNAHAARIKAALGGPNAARVQALFGSVNGLIKTHDFTQAGKQLDELESLLGPAHSGAPSPPPGPPPGGINLVIERFKELAAAIKKALVQPVPDAARIQKLSLEVGGLIKNKDFEQADRLLDELEPLVEDLMEAETVPADESRGIPAGASPKVAFAISRLQWQDAKKSVEQQLGDLQAAITSEYKDEEARRAAVKTERVLSRFNEGLADTLDEMMNQNDESKRHASGEKSAGIVDRYLKYLESDPLLALVASNPFVSVTPRPLLEAPLKKIRAQLTSVVGR